MMVHPKIIQGGMGVGVSNWILARAVARAGQLGVVSGTALAIVMARRLQLGDPGGHLRRALESFPYPAVAQRILARYYIPGGKAAGEPFHLMPFPRVIQDAALVEMTVAANFVEIFLAKEGHDGVVGVNYLEKLQLTTLPSLYGAMLAGADYVLMGAGVPRFIPGVLDQLARGETAQLRVDVADMPAGEQVSYSFDPQSVFGAAPALKRPQFLAIISSATLATTLARKSNGKVDGFVVEGSTAGGHNAPPRGDWQMNERGEPIYSVRDLPDLPRIKEIGLPFWMAGSYAEPEKLAEAMGIGATGVQVGTAFAFCEESGLTPEIKRQAIEQALAGGIDVLTDALASPTGFPFKVVQLPGTLAEQAVYQARTRECDLGYLRSIYRKSDGTIGYRCPAEPVSQYQAKGGDLANTHGRKCLCNGLLAAIGLGQVQDNGAIEKPLLTAGDDIKHIARFLKPPRRTYTAADVIHYLLSEKPAAVSADPC